MMPTAQLTEPPGNVALLLRFAPELRQKGPGLDGLLALLVLRRNLDKVLMARGVGRAVESIGTLGLGWVFFAAAEPKAALAAIEDELSHCGLSTVATLGYFDTAELIWRTVRPSAICPDIQAVAGDFDFMRRAHVGVLTALRNVAR